MKKSRIGASSLAVMLAAVLTIGGAGAAFATDEVPAVNEPVTAPTEELVGAQDLAEDEASGVSEEAPATAESEGIEATEVQSESDPAATESAEDPGAQSRATSGVVLPANRTVSGTLVLPADFPEALKSQISVKAKWANSTFPHPRDAECGIPDGPTFIGSQQGSFDPATGDWSVTGLGDCAYNVTVELDPSAATNGWTFVLFSAQWDNAIDLAQGDITGLKEVVPSQGGIEFTGFLTVIFGVGEEGFLSSASEYKMIATNTLTGEEVIPESAGTGYGGITYAEQAVSAQEGMILPPGTYTLRAEAFDGSKTVWFNGTTNGTLNAGEATALTVRAWWGENVGGPYVFDLTSSSAPDTVAPGAVTTGGKPIAALAETGGSGEFLATAAFAVLALMLAGAGSVVYGRRRSAAKI